MKEVKWGKSKLGKFTYLFSTILIIISLQIPNLILGERMNLVYSKEFSQQYQVSKQSQSLPLKSNELESPNNELFHPTDSILENSPSCPLPRSGSAMVYVPSIKKFILFGGVKQGNYLPEDYLNDTWAYDPSMNTWTNLNPANPPPGRESFAMAYNSQTNQIIIHGGWGGWSGNQIYSDTWAYDPSMNTWTNLNPANPPPGRYGHEMVFDSQSGKIILFGGWGHKECSDTWAYDALNNNWTNLNPYYPPLQRGGHSMAYDSLRKLVFLFGGYCNPQGCLNDSWVYNYATNAWFSLNPIHSPPGNDKGAIVYLPQKDKIILFGGWNFSPLNNTWEYDPISNDWSIINSPNSPPARSGHAMALDPESGKIILFGGWDNQDNQPTFFNDTWAFDPQTNNWINLSGYQGGSLSLTSPQGGEHWAVGSQHSITWTSTNLSGNLKIQLSRDGGATWPETLASSVPVSQGSWSWTVSGPISGKCRVRLTSEADPSIQATSGDNFIIYHIHRVALVFAKWSDTPSSMAKPTDIGAINPLLDSLKEYYHKNSYGLVELEFSLFYDRAKNDWLKMEIPQKDDCVLKSDFWGLRKYLELSEFLDTRIHPTAGYWDHAVETATKSAGLVVSNFDAVVALAPTLWESRTKEETDAEALTWVTFLSSGSYVWNKVVVPARELIDGPNWKMLAHELGHTLGAEDRYGKTNGDLTGWDLMGMDSGRILHMSSFTKSTTPINWLGVSSLPEGTVTITPLASLKAGDQLIKIPLQQEESVSFYLLDSRHPIPGEDEVNPGNHVLIYGCLWKEGPTGKTFPHWKVSLLGNLTSIGQSYLDPRVGKWIGLTGYNTIKIENKPRNFFSDLKGAFLDFLGAITFGEIPEQMPDELESGTDLDLHAYAEDGRHIGMNYQTGEYENQIEGSCASGDIVCGDEWIYVPQSIPVRFVVVTKTLGQPQALTAQGEPGPSEIVLSQLRLLESDSSGNFQETYTTTYSILSGTQTELSQTATLSGHVYYDRNGNNSFDPGEGIVGATITATPFATVTSTDGLYNLAISEGTYTFSVAMPGYLPGDFSGIVIPQPPATLTQDLALSPAIPPSAPASLTANYSGGSVELSWSAAQAGSYPVRGYWIFRSTTPGGQDYLQPINSELVTGTTYTDSMFEEGATNYYYTVKAMDDQGILGEASPEARVLIPLLLSSPNGGESWNIGSSQNITWTSTGVTGNVKIELNRNYPSGSWETIFASTPNDGTESWVVTGPVSSACRIRVSSLDDPSVFDISDGNFTIEEGTPGPAHMPSLSPWGLALLGVSLLTVAVFGITRGKRKKA